MKERIEQLAAGSVVVKRPELEFSPAYLEGTVPAGILQSREIIIRVKNKVSFKGFFYSTNERIRLGTKQAAGQSAAILFEINTQDCRVGDELKGAIIMVGNAGECRVEYSYRVCRAMNPEQQPENLEDFTAMYQRDPSAALRLFTSDEFIHLPFMEGNIKRVAVYEGLLESGQEHQALDAFLVAMEQKQPVYLEPETDRRVIRAEDLGEEEQIVIKASSWGWLRGEVAADCSWITLKKKVLTHRDFENQEARLSFRVDVSRLHRGRNLGRIKLTTPQSSQTVSIEIIMAQGNRAKSSERPPKAVVRYLYRLLLAYINESHEEEVIFSQMDQCLEENIKKYPACMGLHLYRVWLFQQQGRVREAKSVLDWCRSTLEKGSSRPGGQYSLMLFLEALISGRKEDMDRARERTKEICQTDQSLLALLVGILVNTQLSAAGQLQLLEGYHTAFGGKPIIYAFAARIFRESPGEIRKVGSFQLQVLSYMLRYSCLTQEVADQYLALPLSCIDNEELIYQVMKRLYACYKDDRVLTQICSSLIRLGRKSSLYRSWFELGVQQGVNLTGLYDAFMTSVADEIPNRELPVSILLYYSYKNDLDNQTRLNLYTYILNHYTAESDMYLAYEDQMDEFAIRQLLDGRINSQLVHLYDNLLSPGLIDEHLGKVLPALLYSRQVTCNLPFARKAVVHYAQLRVEQSARITGGQVTVPVYTPDAAILFEDAMGNRYYDPQLKTIPLMYREDLIAVCREKAPDQLMLLTAEADVFYEEAISGADGMKLAMQLQRSPEIRPSFGRLLTERMVDYCYFHNSETREYDGWLMTLNLRQLPRQQRTRVLELYIQRGYYREAFEGICVYGSETIQPDLLLKLTVRRITETLYEYNDCLIVLCRQLLAREQIHETLLTYLCMHYNGPTEIMFQLLLAADQARVDSRDLAKRVVEQMLFTGEKEHLDRAYEIYCKGASVSETLSRAVLVLRCHDSLIEESALPDEVVRTLQNMMEQPGSSRLPVVFSLALLQQYSRMETLAPQAKHTCEQLLYAFCAKGIYLKCFHRLAHLVELPHQMEGRIIIQWVGQPESQVRLKGELKPQGKEIFYDMQEVYPGIYTADVFLFPDEEVQVSVMCKKGQKEEVVKEVLLDASACYCRRGSIYAEIQKLIQLEEKESFDQWKTECARFIRNGEAVKELFTLL